LEWPGPPSSWSGPRTRAFRPLQTAFPGPCRGARLPSVIRWPALCPVVRAGRRVTRGRPCRSAGQQHATPKPGNRRGRPGCTRRQRRRRVCSGATARLHGPSRCGSAWYNRAAARRPRQAPTRSSAERRLSAAPRPWAVPPCSHHRATASGTSTWAPTGAPPPPGGTPVSGWIPRPAVSTRPACRHVRIRPSKARASLRQRRLCRHQAWSMGSTKPWLSASPPDPYRPSDRSTVRARPASPAPRSGRYPSRPASTACASIACRMLAPAACRRVASLAARARPLAAVPVRPVATTSPLRPGPLLLQPLHQSRARRLPGLGRRVPRQARHPPGGVLLQGAPARPAARDVQAAAAVSHSGRRVGVRRVGDAPPGGGLAGVRSDAGRRPWPGRAASCRHALPLGRGVPPRGGLRVSRLPRGFQRAFPRTVLLRRPVARATAPPRFRPSAVSGWPRPCRKSRLPAGNACPAQAPLGPPPCWDVSLPACRGLWTPADLRRLATTEALVWPSVRVTSLGVRHQLVSKRSPPLRGRGHPDGRPAARSTLRPSCAPWHATTPPWPPDALRVGGSPFPDRDVHPARDATLSWRENAHAQRRRSAVRCSAWFGPGGYLPLCQG
jgi:hypothetical protein